nr:immunoglobulin heavy chain junction region [Mus musculus]
CARKYYGSRYAMDYW